MSRVDGLSRSIDGGAAPSPGARKVVVALILLASLVANSVGIEFGQPRHYDQSVDAIPPVLSVDAALNVFGERSTVGIKYPPVHFVVTGAVERAYLRWRYGAEDSRALERDMLQVLAESDAGVREWDRDSWRPWAEPIGGMIIAGRWVSAVMGTLLVLGVLLFGRALFGFTVGAIAAALTAVSYPVVFYSHTLNVDVPYLCWGVFALHAGVRAVQTGSPRWLTACGVLAAFSAATKDQAYGWFLATGPLILILMARPGGLASSPTRQLSFGGVLWPTAITVAAYLALLGSVFDLEAVRLHFEHIFGAGVDPYRVHQNTVSGHVDLLRENVSWVLDGLGWPVMLLSCVGAALALRADVRRGLLVLVPALSYYASFIAPIGYTTLRFTIPIQMMLLVAAAVPLGWALASPRLRWVGAALLAICVGQGVTRTVALDRMLLADPRPAAIAYMAEHVADGAGVIRLESTIYAVEPPPHARVQTLSRAALEIPAEFGHPDYLLVAYFDPSSDGSQAVLPELELLGYQFAIEQKFEPALSHPIRRDPGFQPTILLYRRVGG